MMATKTKTTKITKAKALASLPFSQSMKDCGLIQQAWSDNHVYFMTDRNAAGQPEFIDRVMSLAGLNTVGTFSK